MSRDAPGGKHPARVQAARTTVRIPARARHRPRRRRRLCRPAQRRDRAVASSGSRPSPLRPSARAPLERATSSKQKAGRYQSFGLARRRRRQRGSPPPVLRPSSAFFFFILVRLSKRTARRKPPSILGGYESRAPL